MGVLVMAKARQRVMRGQAGCAVALLGWVKGCREIDACGGQQGEGEGEVCVEVSAVGALHQSMCTCTKESAALPTTTLDVLPVMKCPPKPITVRIFH